MATADEGETAAFLAEHDAELVVLAGYMRILSPDFVGRYSGRIMNVHPSLLPAFPGRTAIADALAQGVRVTGATVHLIEGGASPQVDSGPIVKQEAVEVPATTATPWSSNAVSTRSSTGSCRRRYASSGRREHQAGPRSR